MKSYNDVQGFPTIAYLENGKKMETYEGEREEDQGAADGGRGAV